MIELQKKDIPVLDFIVNELSKSGTYIFTLNDLQKEQKFRFGKNEFTSIENMLNHQLKLNESRIPALEKKVDSLNKKLNLLKSKLIVNKEKP